MELLVDALTFQNDGLTSSDVTIGTCWDADRMDLPRVGITPIESLMSTKHGKNMRPSETFGYNLKNWTRRFVDHFLIAANRLKQLNDKAKGIY